MDLLVVVVLASLRVLDDLVLMALLLVSVFGDSTLEDLVLYVLSLLSARDRLVLVNAERVLSALTLLELE